MTARNRSRCDALPVPPVERHHLAPTPPVQLARRGSPPVLTHHLLGRVIRVICIIRVIRIICGGITPDCLRRRSSLAPPVFFVFFFFALASMAAPKTPVAIPGNANAIADFRALSSS